MVRKLVGLVAGLTLFLGLFGGTAQAAPPGFGTDPVSRPSSGPGSKVTGVTVEAHEGFDRVVFAIEGSDTFGYHVGYVSGFYTTNDKVVVVEGTTFLEVQVRGTRDWLDPSARVTLTPHLPALRQLKYVEEFEGQVRYGLGLSNGNGFRVSTLSSPPRLVVDVAH